MAHYKIQKGIPIPVGDWKKDQYPLAEMEIGDSFLVTFAEDKTFTRKPITDFEKLNPLFKFLVKKAGLKQYRVWRIPANAKQELEYIATLVEDPNIHEQKSSKEEEDTKITTYIAIHGEKKIKRPYNTKKRQQQATQDSESIEAPVSSSQVIAGQM